MVDEQELFVLKKLMEALMIARPHSVRDQKPKTKSVRHLTLVAHRPHRRAMTTIIKVGQKFSHTFEVKSRSQQSRSQEVDSYV